MSKDQGAAFAPQLWTRNTELNEQCKLLSRRRQTNSASQRKANRCVQLAPVLFCWRAPQRPAICDNRDDERVDQLANDLGGGTKRSQHTGHPVRSMHCRFVSSRAVDVPLQPRREVQTQVAKHVDAMQETRTQPDAERSRLRALIGETEPCRLRG